MTAPEVVGAVDAMIRPPRIMIGPPLLLPLVVLAGTFLDPQPFGRARLQRGSPVAAQGQRAASAHPPVATAFTYVMAAILVPFALVIPRLYANWACRAIADGTWLTSTPRTALDLNLTGILDTLGRMSL